MRSVCANCPPGERRSNTAARNPARAAYNPAVKPAGPAPITATSKVSLLGTSGATDTLDATGTQDSPCVLFDRLFIGIPRFRGPKPRSLYVSQSV